MRGVDDDASGSCRLEVWVPDTGRGEPGLRGDNVGSLGVRAVPGGFVVSGCARGAYVLRGAPDGTGPGGDAAGGVSGPERACRSRRRFAITLRVPRRVRLRTVVVRVRGTKTKTRRLRGTRRRVVIDLRGQPRGRVVVRITARARNGRRFSERRSYRTCVRSRTPR